MIQILWPLVEKEGRSPMSTQEFTDALKRPGWLTFAAVVLFSVGILRAISAIYYFADSARINNLGNGAFSDNLWLWGLWDAGIAVLALWAGYSLLSGNAFGRVIGYIWAIVVIVQSLLILSWSPWYGFAGLLLAILVIYALSTTSEWTESSSG
jgi:hypothetical protein